MGAPVAETINRSVFSRFTMDVWTAVGVELQAEVREWLSETRTLLRAAEILAEWFTEEGADPDDHARFKASLDLPYQNLELIDEWLRVGDSASALVSRWTAQRFETTRDLASAISPLLERIVRYVPDFITEARAEPQGVPTPKLVLLWGMFVGNLGRYVCTPLWKMYPECAPPDWSA